MVLRLNIYSIYIYVDFFQTTNERSESHMTSPPYIITADAGELREAHIIANTHPYFAHPWK